MCNNKCDYLEIENATLTQGDSATVIVAPEAFNNRRIYRMRYCVKFTGATGTETFQISDGINTYPVWDRNGEPLKLGRLRRRELLYLRFIGSTPAHFTLGNYLYPICIKTPEI